MLRHALTLAAALLTAAPGLRPAAAQAPGAELAVTVTDAATGQPLSAARVVLTGWRRAHTDHAGLARFGGVEAGTQTVEAVLLGYASRAVIVSVPTSGKAAVALALTPDAVELDALRASARPAPRTGRVQGFYERAAHGVGTYFTREDIERLKPRALTDLFRHLPGMDLVMTPLGEQPRVEAGPRISGGRARGRGECPIMYYVDGVPYEPSHRGMIGLDISPAEVEGIEVYMRNASAPAQYRVRTDVCGVVLIWKREKFG